MPAFNFIVLEGLDCSGKTTLSKHITDRLQPCTRVFFPDRTSRTGVVIDRFLKKQDGLADTIGPHELHLLYAADRYAKAGFIRNALKTGNVVCDRYWFSGTAYSTAKGLDYEWCKSVDSNLPRPDYTFFIDADEKTVASRRGFGEEAHDRVDFQKRVYGVYRDMISREGIIPVDGTGSIEEVLEEILVKIQNKD